MAVAHQGALSGPWCGKTVCQVQLLAVGLVAVAVDCMFVMLVCQ